MTFSEPELHRLNYAVQVAEAATAPGNPVAKHLLDLRVRVEQELEDLSRRRNESLCSTGELDRDELVGTADAARILGISQRRIQQLIRDGDLEATVVNGTFVIRQKDLLT